MLLAFVHSHSVALSALAVALLDFAVAVNPALESNSMVQLVMSIFKKKAPSA